MSTQTYTQEQTAQLLEKYQAGQTVDELALMLGKSVRSVVAKLSREGVYQKKIAAAKSTVTKKLELVLQLELFAGVELKSLQKATREDLEKLVQFVKREG